MNYTRAKESAQQSHCTCVHKKKRVICRQTVIVGIRQRSWTRSSGFRFWKMNYEYFRLWFAIKRNLESGSQSCSLKSWFWFWFQLQNPTQFWSRPKQMINCRLIYIFQKSQIWFGLLRKSGSQFCFDSLVLSESLEPSSGSKPGSINQTWFWFSFE
jgi:hypothetical protein